LEILKFFFVRFWTGRKSAESRCLNAGALNLPLTKLNFRDILSLLDFNLQHRAHANIEFLGWVDDASLAELYSRCEALILPGEEDFGIVPLEAQASGRPVIAYGRGGALETVVPLESAILITLNPSAYTTHLSGANILCHTGDLKITPETFSKLGRRRCQSDKKSHEKSSASMNATKQTRTTEQPLLAFAKEN